jgi:GT2 family glycosyltransferase
MNVSVIIINHNRFDLTADCIQSLIDHTKGIDYEIILVDNASTGCDPGKFEDKFPQVKLIRSAVNGGFAYGNNLGREEAAGDYVLLLNNDTVLKEDSISKAVDYLRRHPQTGVLGCRMIYPGGDVQHSARRFRSISWELLDLFRFIPMMMGYQRRSKLMLGRYFHCERDIECDWVNGAFFIFNRKIIQELPGKKLDERFFMYGEDQLWCWQIKKLGYKISFYAGTTITHIHSGSSDPRKQLSLRRTMMKHELEIMRERKGRGLYYLTFSAIYVFKDSLRNVAKWLVLTFSGKLPR